MSGLIIRNGTIIAAAAAAAALGLLSSGARAQGAPLFVQVKGVRSNRGSVRVDVCTAETFLRTTCPYSGVARAVVGVTTVMVDGLPPGTYAVQLFHDRNDNGRLDRGALGIPKESLGFSNDAPLGLHGPSFARAAFVHTHEPQTITVSLHHFGNPQPLPRQTQDDVP